jgi:hypothetical protein
MNVRLRELAEMNIKLDRIMDMLKTLTSRLAGGPITLNPNGLLDVNYVAE